MRLPRLTPHAYRRITGTALVAQVLIVVTGAAVRLTSSGLGCTTWPRCTPGSLTPELSWHPLVEFANRMVGLLVGATVLVVLVGALLRLPRRRDLTLLALGLLAGFLGQAVLGGLTVLFHLIPPLVMGHFALSMLLVADAAALHLRAGSGPGPAVPAVRREVRLLGRLVVAATAVVVVLGTAVTGSGPNSGSAAVRRLPIDVRSMAQLHSDAVLFLVGVSVALAVVLSMVGAPALARRRARLLLGLLVAQAAVGFTQFFLGLARARALVEVHVLGATLCWLLALALLAALSVRPPREDADTALVLPAEAAGASVLASR